jgi:hypothetical protein
VRTLILDIGKYLAANARWLLSLWRIWGAIAVVVAVAVLSTLIPAKPEDQIRYCGLALQLLGVGTVVALLQDKSQTFGRLGFFAFLRDRLAARPKFRPRAHVVNVTGIASASATGSARISVWRQAPEPAAVEDRLSALEGNTESLRQDLEWHSQQNRQASEKLRSELEAERGARRDGIAVVEGRLNELGAGGLHIEAAGLFWLVLGIVLATIPLELAQLLGLAK